MASGYRPLPLTPLGPSSSWSMARSMERRWAEQSRTQDSPGVCAIQSRGRWRNCSGCSPEDRPWEGLGSGCSSHRWVPRAQHRGWPGWQETSVVVCRLLPQDTKYLRGLPNFSGIQFTVDSYLGDCQLKPEFSPHVLLLRLSPLWPCATDFPSGLRCSI